MKLLFSICLLPMFFWQVNPNEVNGWNKAKWGMKESEIISAFPEATKLEKPETYHGGTYVSIVIPDLEVVGNHFRVNFQMDTFHVLNGVLMKYLDTSPVVAFSSVGNLLVERYGAPVNKDENKTSSTVTKTWTWVFPKTKIELRYTKISGLDDMLTIHYRPTKSSPASKF